MGRLTISSGIVRLDVYGFDLAILDDEGVALGTCVTKDGYSVKAEV
jgi:hypothetical protein